MKRIMRQAARNGRFFIPPASVDGADRTRAVLAAMDLQGEAWPFYSPWSAHSPEELRVAAAKLTAAADAWDAIPGRSYEAGHCRHEAARCLVKAEP